MRDSKKENNRVAIVGGGSKGLGFGCALELAKKGVNIVLCARNPENLSIAAKRLELLDIKVLPLAVDLSDKAANELIIRKTLEKFGKIDILINNSGGPLPGKYDQLSESDWYDAFESVLMYNIRMTQLAVESMKANKWGRIINVTSLSVKEPAESLILSNVFRTGVVAFAKSISKDLIKYNITINNLCPGAFMTDRAIELIKNAAKNSGRTPDEVENENKQKLPLGRYQLPEELGSIVAFLASDAAAGITGTTMSIDGGISNSLI